MTWPNSKTAKGKSPYGFGVQSTPSRVSAKAGKRHRGRRVCGIGRRQSTQELTSENNPGRPFESSSISVAALSSVNLSVNAGSDWHSYTRNSWLSSRPTFLFVTPSVPRTAGQLFSKAASRCSPRSSTAPMRRWASGHVSAARNEVKASRSRSDGGNETWLTRFFAAMRARRSNDAIRRAKGALILRPPHENAEDLSNSAIPGNNRAGSDVFPGSSIVSGTQFHRG